MASSFRGPLGPFDYPVESNVGVTSRITNSSATRNERKDDTIIHDKPFHAEQPHRAYQGMTTFRADECSVYAVPNASYPDGYHGYNFIQRARVRQPL